MHYNKISIDKNRKKIEKYMLPFLCFPRRYYSSPLQKCVFEGDLLLEKVEFFLSIDVFYSHKHQKKHALLEW